MSGFSPSLRIAVIERAGNKCEYCKLRQVGQEAVFHIDHVIPRSAKGRSTDDNLALACASCSLHKAARRSAIDPESELETLLFNPRLQQWSEYFRWEGCRVVALTAIGRATVSTLKMNRSRIQEIRGEEALRGRHP